MTQGGSSAIAPQPGALTTDERAELERLRSQVRALQTTGRPARTGFRWRSVTAVVLIVLGCVLAPVAGLAVWTSNQVSDTDRFVRSVSPLIDDPDVQGALTDRLTATVFEYVDVESLADDAVDALVGQGQRHRVTGHLRHRTGGPGAQHALREVAGDGAHPARGELDGGHGRAGSDVEHRLPRPGAQCLPRRPPPGGVQPAREHRVGDVVALRDPVEHRGDLGRPLVQIGPQSGGVLGVSPVDHGGDATRPSTLEP